MAGAALEGVVAVEAGNTVAAAYCGKLLADLGARVILVEPPAGSQLRREGPPKEGGAHSGLFAHLAANKESIALDAAVPADRATFASIVASADIFIGEGGSSWEREQRAWPQQLVRVDLSLLGRSGPYAGWKMSELTAWALGGFMYFTGEGSREPLVVPGRQAEFHGGMHGALAALAALHEQRRSGIGQSIEVSAVEAVLAAHWNLTINWSHTGTIFPRTTHDLIRCQDGWVMFMQLVRYINVFVLIDRPELMDDPRWPDQVGWAVHQKEIWGLVGDWCRDRTRDEIVSAAQELRIACAPVNAVNDLASSPQLREREWWLDVEDSALGQVRLPGFPYRLSMTPPSLRHGAPALDAHGASLRREFEAPPAVRGRTSAPTGEGPLKGLRVVEVTANWAGPVAGRHLGDLGADVIKVEAPTRPATRGGYWPGGDLQRQPYNRSGYFNNMNRNKRDLVVDLGDPGGKAAFIQLVKTADVLIENNSARVMPNLGLGYDVLAAANPGLVMVSISGSGATGPERDFLSFGSNIEASCGLASLVGYDDSQPYRTGSFYADPVSGAHAVVAILAALEHRRRTGEGQWIDLSLNECAAGFFAEALIDFQLNGAVRPRQGNRDARFSPQGAYRCAGNDNWVALTVSAEDEWRALCGVIGREDFAADPGLVTLDGRAARSAEVDAAIGAWAATRESYEAAWALQHAGVAAAPVLANWQLLTDPHLYRRGFYVDIEHPVVGVLPFPGWPWKLSRTPAAVRRPAPLFGEHNREVLAEIGLGQDAFEELVARGIVADVPRL